jgi:hypothetical protein
MRDPRINPMPGDVLRNGRKKRTVHGRGDRVGFPYAVWGDECVVHVREFLCLTLQGWWRWAKDAEVLQRGEERDSTP